jgi:hypothetical protein
MRCAYARSAQIVFHTIKRTLDGGALTLASGGATTNSGVSVPLALMKVAMHKKLLLPGALMHSYGDHLILARSQPSVRRNGALEVVVFLAGNEAEVFQRRQ